MNDTRGSADETPPEAGVLEGWEEASGIAEPAYRIDERPSALWESLLYGWQHTLVDISPFVLPLAVAGALGMTAAGEARFVNFCLFAMGVATLIQTTVGNRLPIVQGPSAVLTATLVPVAGQLGAGAMWGAVLVGGAAEMVAGGTRLVGALRRWFPPAVAGVVVLAIALALGELAVSMAVGEGTASEVGLAGLAILAVLVVQLRLGHVAGGLLARGAILLTIATVGVGLAALLGLLDTSVIAERPWLALPELFPYGGPGFGWEFPAAAVLAVLAGYFGSMAESLGDYAATCAVADETFTVEHMNRGIFAEGLGSVVAACLGGLPCTSYTQNVGVIATTGVASRHVVRIAAVVLLLYGLCPKLGALLVAIPRPVLGGVFLIVCATIAASGVGLLRAARRTTGARLVIGLTLVSAVAVPIYVEHGLGQAWLDGVPSFVGMLLTNRVVLAVLLAVGLNAAVRGLERGGERRAEDS